MEYSKLANQFKKYLDGLSPGAGNHDWLFKGITTDAFGSPGGSWKGKDGFKFERLNTKQHYIIRCVAEKNYLVIESYLLGGQLYNMNLANKEIHLDKKSQSILLESYNLTARKGRVKKDVVKKTFSSLGINDNVVASINDRDPNWEDLVNSLLRWADLREQVKSNLKTMKEKPKKEKHEEPHPIKYQDFIRNTPLNQILFGPPGTGKTFHLLEKVIPIFKTQSVRKPDDIIESEIISKLPWWKIFALVLLEKGKQTVPQIKKHRFLKYKLEVSNTNSLNQTVWGQLSSHTINESETVEYTARQDPLIFDKDENSVWSISKPNDPAIFELNELMEESKKLKDSSDVTQSNYKFVTFHQSTSYESFIEGITPKLDDDNQTIIDQLSYEIKKGSFYTACDEAAKLAGFLGLKDCLENSKEERVERFRNAAPYCFLIDEINRGNVSAIFGELITLIEEDKRLTKNEIIVELPYSKKLFGVPPNLYIIGTMNTADRSVEALDTALRRRFSFTEMPPLYDLDGLNFPFARTTGTAILELINNRLEKLLDRDHLIGHSYFLLEGNEKPEEKLVDSFYRNIIPLLQEYFFGDYAKIGAVLGSGFVFEESSKALGIFASGFENDDYNDKEIYQIIDYREGQPGNKYIQDRMTFEKAIQLLMNQPIEKQVEA